MSAALPETTASFRALARSLLDVARGIVTASTDTERTQRDALLAFGVRVASAAILYLSQIVLARWMGAFEYGVYVSVWTWVLILGGVSHLGLATTVMRLVPAYRAQGRLGELAGLLAAGRWVALIGGTIVAGLGATGLWWLGDRLDSQYLMPAYLALVCVPLFALAELQDGIGRGSAMLAVGLVPPYVLRPLLVLVAMLGAFAAGLPMTATTAAAAAIGATWGASLVQLILIRRRFEPELAAAPRRYDLAVWLRLSLPMLVVMASEIALQNTDLLVVARYLPAGDVAVYFAASKTMSLVLFVHYAVGSAVASRFAALAAAGDAEQLQRFVRDAVAWTFWPSLIGAMLILALGRPLLWLFGPQFTDGYGIMFILVVGFLARASVGPADFLLNMLGEQKLCAIVLAATAVLNVGLALLLVPRLGLAGAALATTTALVSGAVLNTLVARHRLGIEVSVWSRWRRQPTV